MNATQMASLPPADSPDASIYTEALAEGYDAVMSHVDYRRWAGHAHDLLQAHAPENWPLGPRRLLELGCGTGALARWLQPLGPYRYLATDRSGAMLAVARREARARSLPVRFRPVDFTRIGDDLATGDGPFAPPFDAVLLLYDGLNYLLDEHAVARLLAEAAGVLRPGGLFLFDHTTPANSEDPTEFDYEGAFEDAGDRPVQFRRTSRYDPARRLHETVFEFEIPRADDANVEENTLPRRVTERHVQRAYAVEEIRRLVHASPLTPVAPYDRFTTDPPTDRSRRVHWVARR